MDIAPILLVELVFDSFNLETFRGSHEDVWLMTMVYSIPVPRLPTTNIISFTRRENVSFCVYI